MWPARVAIYVAVFERAGIEVDTPAVERPTVTIVPPPYEVQLRAWERAAVLREDFSDVLPIEDRIAVEVVFRTHPDGLGWLDITRMVVLFRETADVRV